MAHELVFYNEGPLNVLIEIRGSYRQSETIPRAWAYRSRLGGVELHFQVLAPGGLIDHYVLKVPAKKQKR